MNFYTLCIQRGRAVWQLVWLITRRSQVQILPPQHAQLKVKKLKVCKVDTLILLTFNFKTEFMSGQLSWLERGTHKPEVESSNLSPDTQEKLKIKYFGGVAQLGQSVCLSRRRSPVRARSLPQNENCTTSVISTITSYIIFIFFHSRGLIMIYS